MFLTILGVILKIIFKAGLMAALVIIWLNLPIIFEFIKNFLCQWKEYLEKLIDRLKF